MKRTMFIVMSAAMIIVSAPAMAKQTQPKAQTVTMPKPPPPMPIMRQPVEPCPKSGCPIIKGPEIGTRGSK